MAKCPDRIPAGTRDLFAIAQAGGWICASPKCQITTMKTLGAVLLLAFIASSAAAQSPERHALVQIKGILDAVLTTP